MAFEQGKVDNYYTRKNRIIRKRTKQAKVRVKELRGKPTKAEKKMIKLLNACKVKYIFQKPFISEWNFTIVDFYLPHKQLVLEIDGSIHARLDIVKKDKGHNKYHLSKGRKVLRITNEEVYKMTPKKLMKILREI